MTIGQALKDNAAYNSASMRGRRTVPVSNVFEFPTKQYVLSHLLEILVFVSLFMCVTLQRLVLFVSQSVSQYVPVSLSASVLHITLTVVTTKRCVCAYPPVFCAR